MSRDIMDFYCRNASFQEMLQERSGGAEEIHDVLLARRGCAFEQSWERRRLRVLSPVDGGGTDLLSRPHGSNGGSLAGFMQNRPATQADIMTRHGLPPHLLRARLSRQA